MDKIIIKNLEVFCNHGVFLEENTLGQKFIVSVILYTDTRAAGISDDLTLSIHYGEVSHRITTFLKGHTYKLIERVAEELATHLLIEVERLSMITVEIKKPWAPIGLPIEYAGVKITRKWHTVYLALGSNMGDKERYLLEAVEKLKAEKMCKVNKVSSLIETAPYGVLEQPAFLNGCLELSTLLYPEELLTLLQKIEKEAGRKRTKRWGPRTLDLDILFYDDDVIQRENLCIPHVEMQLREFVLIPLEEIAPYKYHPLLNKTVSQLRRDLNG
jgi:dihydroneopterin aldolase/2-amino-4-hydroxy-6-hydroxymethyldihydropteridine pyrophosphokinase